MKYSLVLLTLNEIDGLRHIFDSIPVHEVDEILAVDGGSTDGTLEFYKEKGVRVVTQQSRGGRGDAFRIAMEEAIGDVLIFFSPDGNEDPADIPKFKQHFAEGHDIVIASRMMPESKNEEDDQLLRWRKWANNAFNYMANRSFRRLGPYVTDSINGYRGVRKDSFEKIKPASNGYTIEYEMTIKALKHGLKIKEFPTIEGQRVGGESYAKSIPTGLRFLKLYFNELKNR